MAKSNNSAPGGPARRRAEPAIDRADREAAASASAPAARRGKATTPPEPAANGAPEKAAPRANGRAKANEPAEATRMERADIGLSGDQRAGVSGILNRALSDEHVLYIRTRNYHWNVTGMNFKALHEFFEEQYKALEAAIDEIAERTRSLGFRAIGSMAEFMQHTRLNEQNPAEVPDAVGMLRNLLHDHEAIIKNLRQDIDACEEQFEDKGTADFLTAMLEAHEKMAWMIRAFLS